MDKDKKEIDKKDLLLPKTTDLSYYDWRTKTCVSNDSTNFKVDANSGK